MISVIIVSYNTAHLLKRCLSALYNHSTGHDLEVFVVDNNSADNSVSMVKTEYPEVHLIINKANNGFAAANNQAWKLATGENVLLLNPDAFITSNAITNTIEFMKRHPACGICGGRLVKPDGTPDPSARKFPTFLSKFFTLSGLQHHFPTSKLFAAHEFGNIDQSKPLQVDWVPGTFTMYRRSMLEETGLFDERFYIYYEETDLCLKAKRLGWSVYYLPTAKVIHVGGASSKARKDKLFDAKSLQVASFRMRSEWLYYRKNSGLLSVIYNAGVELTWHGLRWLFNLMPGRLDRVSKRQSSLQIIREIIGSLQDTHWGVSTPPRPW